MYKYKESEYLLLSGIQHLRFCPRQCALIHVEQLWSENVLTADGRVLHDKVHSGDITKRKVITTERNLKISSSLLGLTGYTDAVEIYSDGSIVPVEYKRGEPKDDTCDDVQLCAQVLCLEEMKSCTIQEAALFYFAIRKRVKVKITRELREETIGLSKAFHKLVERGETPKAIYSPKCKSCSLVDLCFPIITNKRKTVADYISNNLS